MGHERAKIKPKKKPFNEDDLDRILESVLHQLYRRSPERFMVIYGRLKEDFEKMPEAASAEYRP